MPIGVVLPSDVDDMVEAHRVCAAYGAPITNRGAGTSLSGEATNVAVIIDSSKHLHRVLDVDPVRRTARVEAGTINDALRDQVRPHGLDFGPDPSTHSRCTIGGNLGNNSCGVHSLLAGRTSDNTVELDVVTYEGDRMTLRSAYDEDEISAVIAAGGRQGEVFGRLVELRDRYAGQIRARFPQLARRVSGYDLEALLPERGFNVAASLVGTEGTCVSFLTATVRLLPWPAHRALVVAGYPSMVDLADAVPQILSHGVMACEVMGEDLVAAMGRTGRDATAAVRMPAGRAFALLELGGDSAEAVRERAVAAIGALRGSGADLRLVESAAETRALWHMRESALGATSVIPGKPMNWPGWEDAAVPPERLGDYLREFFPMLERHGLQDGAVYGHFGDGCVHAKLPFDLTSAGGVAAYRAFLSEAADLVVHHGGSLSGEHGDGQQRAEFLDRMYGADLVAAMREFKASWDPQGRMNPGKVVDPVRLFRADDNLRLGAAYRPGAGLVAEGALRCVGVGKCREPDGGLMCPSYQVLREEKHSTRGRARLLFEMLEGEMITDGWRSAEVFDALDLCLACKGCKTECPTGVDMAAYKAEFLSRHYRRRLRPLHAYAVGLVMYGARAGSHLPRAANALLRSPTAKRMAGVHPEREVPPLAHRTFRSTYAGGSGGGPEAILFPDTFTNFFEPEVGHAVAEVMTAAGWQVGLPSRVLCCGRPLFDQGMLGLAARLFRQTLAVLRDDLRAGLPVVVPEPSCAASFRDELPALLPDDPDAALLSAQTVTLGEFLARHAPEWLPPQVGGRLVVQQHCHHRAVLGTAGEQTVLAATGADVETLPSGCCGLAGGWGYTRDHYDVSMASGERVLFPSVREAPDAAVVADGFSCRTQVRQGTGRQALHTAQVLAVALREESGG